MTAKSEPVVTSNSSMAVTYRPRVLKDLVGQDHVVQQFTGMLNSRKFPSAILLSGMTGSGKTTFAQMIARYVNCDTLNACGKCRSCLYDSKSHPDLIVLNAGTDGRIDDIRSFVQTSRVAPVFRTRFMCIEEAHRCTGASLEALLLPTETPSKNTIWLFCTTNPDSILPTLSNRCVKFSMNRLDQKHIVKRLLRIGRAEGEDFKTEAGLEALKLIADMSDGSMRQAISLFESVLYAVRGGADLNSKTIISFVKEGEVDLDEATASLIAALLNNDLRASIKMVRMSGNVRGLLNKGRWLLDSLIGEKTKTQKFKSYTYRVFADIRAKLNLEFSLDQLLKLQIVFLEAELRLNSTSIDESVVLQTAIARYAFED